MRIGRTLPPAAAPIPLSVIFTALAGYCKGEEQIAVFEQELKQYFNVKYCFAVSSGQAAFVLILQALHTLYPERSEVIIPALTCYSVPAAVKQAGLSVRLCDLDPETLGFDFAELEHLLAGDNAAATGDELNSESGKPLPLCVLPTHLFGLPADIARVQTMAGRDVVVVEDAAQAMGGEHDGKKLGTLGDVSFFSLGRGKSLSTMGGGLLLTNRDDIGMQLTRAMAGVAPATSQVNIRLFIQSIVLAFFLHPNLFWLPKSLPFLGLGDTLYEQNIALHRLSSFQAGLARGWQTRLDCFLTHRRQKISGLRKGLASFSGQHYCRDGQDLPALVRFPVRCINRKTRDTLLQKSEQAGLGIMAVYPTAVSGIPELMPELRDQKCYNAETLSATLVTLPVHPYVTSADNDKLIHLFNNVCGRNSAQKAGG